MAVLECQGDEAAVGVGRLGQGGLLVEPHRTHLLAVGRGQGVGGQGAGARYLQPSSRDNMNITQLEEKRDKTILAWLAKLLQAGRLTVMIFADKRPNFMSIYGA